jgi:hypothetical protein
VGLIPLRSERATRADACGFDLSTIMTLIVDTPEILAFTLLAAMGLTPRRRGARFQQEKALTAGSVGLSGNSAELLGDERVKHLYLGGKL